MLSNQAIKTIQKVTDVQSMKEWKAAVRRMFACYDLSKEDVKYVKVPRKLYACYQDGHVTTDLNRIWGFNAKKEYVILRWGISIYGIYEGNPEYITTVWFL